MTDSTHKISIENFEHFDYKLINQARIIKHLMSQLCVAANGIVDIKSCISPSTKVVLNFDFGIVKISQNMPPVPHERIIPIQ